MQHAQIQQEQRHLETAVRQALEIAADLGATEAEVSIGKQTGISVSTRNGELESVEFNKDGALGIALYRNGCKGSASTTDLSPSAIRAAVTAALEIANYTSRDEAAGIPTKESLAWDAPDLDLFHETVLDPALGIELAQQCERLALGRDKRIKHSDGASFTSHQGIRVYGNSLGFVKSYPSSRHSLSLVLIAAEGEQMQRDYGWSSSRRLEKLWTPERIADEALQRTVSRLGARKLATCQAPILFHPEVATSLFSHLVQAISGGNLYRKSSFLQEKLNQTIFPEWLTIEELPHLREGLASVPFDSEGVQTLDRRIIEEGRLLTWLLTTYSGRKLGLPSTGHAGGIHNWRVSSSGEDHQQLLRKMGTGLLVTELMGQGVNIVNGDYSRGAAGFWVENGEIAYPVEEITIAGNLNEMFKNIVAVGNDVDERSSIQTGSILLDTMQIAGA